MKTRLEIVERALRSLRVLAQDDPATAEMLAEAGGVLGSIFAEINALRPGVPFDPRSGVPDEALVPLAQLLAAEIAPDYGEPPPVSRARAWLRVRALYVTDDRDDCDCGPAQDYSNA